MHTLQSTLVNLTLYIACVIIANLLQGLVVLPIFLWWKGVSPVAAFRGMAPALTCAFFSKSSSSTLPVATQCIEQNMGVSQRVSRFTLPLCSTINMNACAAFILITVLFVGVSNGMSFSPVEMLSWIIIATVAAVGNAGVPLGCYFLASSFVAALGLPLEIMGIILPIYGIIDMLETALNVWSDSCIAIVVDKELASSHTKSSIQ